MADIKTQVQELINELPVPEETKQSLTAKLNTEGPTVDFFVDMRMAMVDHQINVNAQYKPLVDQLKKLEEQEQAEMGKAYQEFEKEMDELDEDAEALDKAASQAVKDQELEDARKGVR